MNLAFMNKNNRNNYFKNMPNKEQYRKSSIRGQSVSPHYIKDYEKETNHVLSNNEKGFGNTLYKTLFLVLYMIEEKF